MNPGRVRIWDLPTRLFHWALAALVVAAFVTAKAGGAWFDWHPRIGFAILTLVLFRVLWGFAGSHYALFATFVRPPWHSSRAADFRGHTTLGAYSVLAMLGVLGVQAVLGLFANDAVTFEGPWVRFISAELSETLSTLHRRGPWVIGALVALHVAAIVWYTQIRGEPLVSAMVTGERALAATGIEDDRSLRLRALVLFALSAALVYWVVNL